MRRQIPPIIPGSPATDYQGCVKVGAEASAVGAALRGRPAGIAPQPGRPRRAAPTGADFDTALTPDPWYSSPCGSIIRSRDPISQGGTDERPGFLGSVRRDVRVLQAGKGAGESGYSLPGR